MPVRISIRIESGSDMVRGPRGKMDRRARKLNNRAIKARERRKGRVNKDDHTTKVSYKLTEPKEKGTKSRLDLDHELRKIEDAKTRVIYESYEEMMEYIYYLEELNKKKQDEGDRRQVEETPVQPKEKIEEQQHYNELSWGGLEDDDSWDLPTAEQKDQEEFQFWNW